MMAITTQQLSALNTGDVVYRVTARQWPSKRPASIDIYYVTAIHPYAIDLVRSTVMGERHDRIWRSDYPDQEWCLSLNE